MFTRLISASSFRPPSRALDVGVPGTASAAATLVNDEGVARPRAGVATPCTLFVVTVEVLVQVTGVRAVDWTVVLRAGVLGTMQGVVLTGKSSPPSSHADKEGGGSWGPETRGVGWG